jgi:hypothetical protein
MKRGKEKFFVSDAVKRTVQRLVEMGKDNATIAIRTGYKISLVERTRKELGI